MKDRRSVYRFHDPNPPAVTAEHILRLFIEVNAGKVEDAVRRALLPAPEPGDDPKGRGSGSDDTE